VELIFDLAWRHQGVRSQSAAVGPRHADARQPSPVWRRGSPGAVGKRRATPPHGPTPNRSAADRSERRPSFHQESANPGGANRATR